MKDVFSSYHPFVNLCYFVLALGCGMFFMHPVCLALSLVGGFSYMAVCKGRKALGFGLKFMLPVLLITAIMNPAFNHRGVTILTYLWSGNPLTLESILFGLATACMLAAVLCWCACLSEVMTADKLVYLFGRIVPALSLMLSMVLRFVPRFGVQLREVSAAQRCIGRDVSNGSVFQRMRHGIRILSILVTWSLENAIDTADSMKSRGYGLKGRTAFALFRFDRRDGAALAVILLLGAVMLAGGVCGVTTYQYFPSLAGGEPSVWAALVFVAYGVLCGLPLMFNGWEAQKWKRLQSNI